MRRWITIGPFPRKQNPSEYSDSLSEKGIDHAYAVDDLAVFEVFGIEGMAAEFHCRGDEGRVPVGERVAQTQPPAIPDQRYGHREHGDDVGCPLGRGDGARRAQWSLDILESNGSDCSTPTGSPHPAQGWRAAPTLGLGEVDALNPNRVASQPVFLAEFVARLSKPDRGLQAASDPPWRMCRRSPKRPTDSLSHLRHRIGRGIRRTEHRPNPDYRWWKGPPIGLRLVAGSPAALNFVCGLSAPDFMGLRWTDRVPRMGPIPRCATVLAWAHSGRANSTGVVLNSRRASGASTTLRVIEIIVGSSGPVSRNSAASDPNSPSLASCPMTATFPDHEPHTFGLSGHRLPHNCQCSRSDKH